jgi:alkaline phosphatase D
MRKLLLLSSIILLSLLNAVAQSSGVISGPMLGPVELRDAKVWLELSPDVKKAALLIQKKGDPKIIKTVPYKGELGNEFNPVSFTIGGLDMNTTYQYTIVINDKPTTLKGEFTTKDLWQWRKPAPDFTFLTGSCSYVNQPIYDRPGKPYGTDSSIFETMAKEKSSAFMLWLGDNWYTREVDYYSDWGLWYRAQYDRSRPVLQPLLKAMPHYATWDDHDFGPNDISKNYILKETSRKVFMNYWANPSYGENGQGIYSMFSYSDLDFFLTDDRWWRSADNMPDSVDGKANPDKKMFGAKQMDWLKNSLFYSQATFKVIVVGSQVLNQVSPFDKLKNFPVEYAELLDFLEKNKISGVIFLSGDRHHSEVIKMERTGNYPLYDITVSPLTSGTHKFFGVERDNPDRVYGLDEKNNYGKVSVTGKRGERVFAIDFIGTKGDKLGDWSVSEKELKPGLK